MTSETDQSIDSVIPSSSLSYLSSPLLAPSFDSDASFGLSASFLWSHTSASDGLETKFFTRSLSHFSVTQPSPPSDFHSFIDSYKLPTDFHGASDSVHAGDPHWSVSSLGSASPNPSTITTITNENDPLGIHQAALAVSASLLSASDLDEPSHELLDLSLPPIANSSSSSSMGLSFPYSQQQSDEKDKSNSSPPSSPSTSLLDSWPSPSSSLSTTSALPLRDHDALPPLPIPLIPLSDLGLRNHQPLNLQPSQLGRSVSSNSESSAEAPASPVSSYSKAPPVERKPARYHHSGPTQSHANDYLDIPYTLRNPTPSRPRFRITLLQFPVDVPSQHVSISVLLHSNKQSAPVASLSVLKDHLPQLNVALPPDFKFDAKSQYRMSVSVTRRGDNGPFWNHSISVPLRGKLRPHPYDM